MCVALITFELKTLLSKRLIFAIHFCSHEMAKFWNVLSSVFSIECNQSHSILVQVGQRAQSVPHWTRKIIPGCRCSSAAFSLTFIIIKPNYLLNHCAPVWHKWLIFLGFSSIYYAYFLPFTELWTLERAHHALSILESHFDFII